MTIRNYLDHTPTIANDVYIADSADVIGRVSIGAHSSVWPQCVIRGDVNEITIGEATNVQDATIIHVTHDGPYSPGGIPTIIGDQVTIGHRVTLHACTVGDLCLLGIGSIIMDGVEVGKHSIIGAGSLVPPNKVLEPGYLWLGQPAKKVRALTKQEIEQLSYSAQHYVKLHHEYQ